MTDRAATEIMEQVVGMIGVLANRTYRHLFG
jgi:hypothetical protein